MHRSQNHNHLIKAEHAEEMAEKAKIPEVANCWRTLAETFRILALDTSTTGGDKEDLHVR